MAGKDWPPWERFNEWVHSICVVTFDLELGQALEVIYPGDAVLSTQEKTNICYLAFPDSNSGTTKDANFHFRIRRGTAEMTPSQATLLERLSPSMSFDPRYLYGFVHFRQQKDPSIHFLPFCLWSSISRTYLACHDIDQWPSPCAGEQLSLPLLGFLLRIRIPCQADLPLDRHSVHERKVFLDALVSLITPLKYYNDYRPFFTIHDSEFKEYSAKGRAPPRVILGVTNPFFIKALDHWPHILKVGDTVESTDGHDRQEKTRRHWDGRTLDTKAGLYTHFKTFLNKDKSVAKKLLKGVQCNILRRHFLELTQSFMIPLERYLSSLMPLKKEMSPFKVRSYLFI
uniref:UDENN domain-containing protein n=1 Tax=Angiostrongylus cantonensis TaxID=6313 RepID=A0A0K0DNY0_ANGCA